jgi:hypothetical protein
VGEGAGAVRAQIKSLRDFICSGGCAAFFKGELSGQTITALKERP